MFYCVPKKISHRILFFIIGFIAFIYSAIAFGQTEQTIPVLSYEWGLSFHSNGEAPIPNLSSTELAVHNACFCGSAKETRLFITFDAGYENGNTAIILDTLKKHNVSAAFFVVGSYIKENPELIKRMINEGHIVGNHTYNHPDMRTKDKQDFIKELADVEIIFEQTTGVPMQKFYRPPEGKFTTENLDYAKEYGYTTVLWSLAYVDWYENKQPTKEKALEKLLPRTHNGAVVLLHSTSATNAAVLDELLYKWEEMGYTFGNISELKMQ